MARTGYLITVYQDINPSSPTYNQTREERTKDETTCPTSAQANWIEDTRYCELTNNGMQTGYEIIVYRDVEPLSSTYNQTREERVLNTTDCEADDATPDWQNIGDPYCRQIVYMPGGLLANDGYMVQQQQDMNEYSPTADQIRDNATLDLEHCPAPSTEPIYNILSESCQTVTVEGVQKNTGKKEVVRIDTNVYSPTYNFGQPETVLIDDPINCPADINYVFSTTSQTTQDVSYNERIVIIDITSTADGDFVSYDYSTNANWVTGVTMEENKAEISISDNDGALRSGTVTFVQSGSGNTITITINQAAVPAPTYVFTSSSQTIQNIAYNANDLTLQVTSTKNGASTGYVPTTTAAWITNIVIGSNGITLSFAENTDDARNTTLTLTQNDSGNTLVFSINQAAAPNYVFMPNGSTTKNMNYDETTTTLSTVSTKDGQPIGMTHYKSAVWITGVTTSGSTATVTTAVNTGAARSSVVTLIQDESHKSINFTINQAAYPAVTYELYSQNGLNTMSVPIDGGNINLSAYISTKNGEYYGDLTFESSESWIQPTGVVNNPSGNIALIQASLESIADNKKETGRTTTIVIKQNNGGLTSNLLIEQRISQTYVNINFTLVNNGNTNVSFSTFHINLENGRSFSFSPGENNVAPGDSITYQASVSNYFINKKLSTTRPVQGSINSGQVVNPDYLSINTTSLVSGGNYTIYYAPASNSLLGSEQENTEEETEEEENNTETTD